MAAVNDPDDVGPYASPACFLHELGPHYLGFAQEQSPVTPAPADRLVPGRPFPPYAYLPGRFPHPVRDPKGHSYQAGPEPTEAAVDPEALRWGMDLFNHGFYWEAHEAWEGPWRLVPRSSPQRDVLQGLILMAAAGVKLREDKRDAARRHGERAASFFRQAGSKAADRSELLGIAVAVLAAVVERAVHSQPRNVSGRVVFDFTVLG